MKYIYSGLVLLRGKEYWAWAISSVPKKKWLLGWNWKYFWEKSAEWKEEKAHQLLLENIKSVKRSYVFA